TVHFSPKSYPDPLFSLLLAAPPSISLF
ncbi:hypothetical protein CSUI_008226, partial [Cystoisospora suis]